jgi:hypothetical protein
MALAGEVEFGRPQYVTMEATTHRVSNLAEDQITGLRLNFTHDPLFLEASKLTRAEGTSQLYGYRVYSRVRVDGGEWAEVGDASLSNAYHFGGSTADRFDLASFQPGFTRPDRRGFTALQPALVDLSQYEKNSCKIDLENHLIAVQLRYDLYNRDTGETLIGEWTEIVAIGKGAEMPEPPTAFPNAPVISDLAVKEDANGEPLVVFNTTLPEEILREITNPLGNLMLEAEIRYNYGPWQKLF